MNARPLSPWSASTRLAVSVALLASAVLLGLGYVGAKAQDQIVDTVTWLNVAVLGVILAGASEIGWLLSARRRVSVLRDHVVEAYGLSAPPVRADTSAVGTAAVFAAGSTWYHRPDCALMAGKPQIPVRQAHDLAPCAVCGG